MWCGVADQRVFSLDFFTTLHDMAHLPQPSSPANHWRLNALSHGEGFNDITETAPRQAFNIHQSPTGTPFPFLPSLFHTGMEQEDVRIRESNPPVTTDRPCGGEGRTIEQHRTPNRGPRILKRCFALLASPRSLPSFSPFLFLSPSSPFQSIPSNA